METAGSDTLFLQSRLGKMEEARAWECYLCDLVSTLIPVDERQRLRRGLLAVEVLNFEDLTEDEVFGGAQCEPAPLLHLSLITPELQKWTANGLVPKSLCPPAEALVQAGSSFMAVAGVACVGSPLLYIECHSSPPAYENQEEADPDPRSLIVKPLTRVKLTEDYMDHGDASGGPLQPGEVGVVIEKAEPKKGDGVRSRADRTRTGRVEDDDGTTSPFRVRVRWDDTGDVSDWLGPRDVEALPDSQPFQVRAADGTAWWYVEAALEPAFRVQICTELLSTEELADPQVHRWEQERLKSSLHTELEQKQLQREEDPKNKELEREIKELETELDAPISPPPALERSITLLFNDGREAARISISLKLDLDVGLPVRQYLYFCTSKASKLSTLDATSAGR